MTELPVSDAPVGDAIDLADSAFLQDPYPEYARVRDAGGVCPVRHSDRIIVARAESVRDILRDSTTYSSTVHKHSAVPPSIAAEVAEIRAGGWQFVPTMGTNDAPLHTLYRRLCNKAFTPRSLAWMEPLVEESAEALAAALPDGEPMDLLAGFAEMLPVWAISRILGLADDKRTDIRRWSLAATASIGGRPTDEQWLANERTLQEYQQFMAAEIESCRRTPKDGLITVLVRAADEEDDPEGSLSMGAMLSLLRELLVAGNETTGKFIAGMVLLMRDSPYEWAAIRSDPARADLIVEEALRMVSPTQTALRRTTRAVDIDGRTLPGDTELVVSLASANHDEEAFPDPERFDPDRPGVRQHVAFGGGPHMCIGAGLARLEAQAALRALARHVDAITPLDPENVSYTKSYIIRGVTALPVVVTRRQEVGAS